jgi:predicted signal transduction protein with EAL and GGDEF domain
VGFADRLNETLPANAAAARLGGDEFAVVVPGRMLGTNRQDSIAELHRDLTRPFDIQGFPLSISVSIGVASAPIDGTNAEDLLAAADLAMYRAKQSETGVQHHHSNQPNAGANGRIDLLSDLARAVTEGQLCAHYQPQIRLSTGEIDTVEALVRWNHPRHGQIQPDEFIGMAEQTDLIDELTDFMLRRAMSEVLLLDRPDISLAVNVSPRSLVQRTFGSMVLNCLTETGFPATRLELEITERAIAGDPERLELTIGRLREFGVRFAIDDFGAGYSSFGSLRQIRADRLKIDKQFMRQFCSSQEDQLVVRTIAELGHGLGLEVVAEGVETADVWNALSEMGCDCAQGYAIARPMTFENLQLEVANWSTSSRVEALA